LKNNFHIPATSTQIIIANVKRANVCQTLPLTKRQAEESAMAVQLCMTAGNFQKPMFFQNNFCPWSTTHYSHHTLDPLHQGT